MQQTVAGSTFTTPDGHGFPVGGHQFIASPLPCLTIPLPRALQVVGRAEPHNLRLGHPQQKRVMTIRENARTQARLW